MFEFLSFSFSHLFLLSVCYLWLICLFFGLGMLKSPLWHLTWQNCGAMAWTVWFYSVTLFLTSWMQMELLKTDSYFKDTWKSSLKKKIRTKALSNENNHPSVFCFLFFWKLMFLNFKVLEVRDITQCRRHCSWESYGVKMTEDHRKILFTSLKFTFFTWEDRIAHMCWIPPYRARCCNKKGTDWVPGVWAQALSPTSSVTSIKSLLCSSACSSITQELCSKWSLSRSQLRYFRIRAIYRLEATTKEKRRTW